MRTLAWAILPGDAAQPTSRDHDPRRRDPHRHRRDPRPADLAGRQPPRSDRQGARAIGNPLQRAAGLRAPARRRRSSDPGFAGPGPLSVGRRRTPTMATILISIILVIVGVLGTFGNVLPDRVGVFAYIAAGIL